MRIVVTILFCMSSLGLLAQDNIFSLEQAIEYALKNNSSVKSAAHEVEAQKQLKRTSFDLPKTEVLLMYGQYNSYAKNDNNITISQSIPFSALGSQAKLNKSLLGASEFQKAMTENELVYQVKQTFYHLAYVYALRSLLAQQDSIFEGFFHAASLRYKTGETNLLEQSTAEAQRNEAKNRLRRIESDLVVLKAQLRALLNSDKDVDIANKHLTEIPLTINQDSTLAGNPSLAYSRHQIEVAAAEKKVQAARLAPDLLVGYFNQTLIGSVNPETGALANSADRFSGFQLGIAVPLWFGPFHGRIRAAEFRTRAAENKYIAQQRLLDVQLQQALQAYEKNLNSLLYYKETGLPNADLILKQSQAAFRNGEIGYAEYLLGLRNATSIKENHLQTLNEYNQSIIYIEFLSGNKLR